VDRPSSKPTDSDDEQLVPPLSSGADGSEDSTYAGNNSIRSRTRNFISRRTVSEALTLLVAMGSLAVSFMTYLNARDTSDVKKAIGNLAELATQTKRQADNAGNQLDVMKQDGRAWIGVAQAVAAPFAISTPVNITVAYTNVGRRPARTSVSFHAITLPIDDWNQNKGIGQIMAWHDGCFAINDPLIAKVNNNQIAKGTMTFPTSGDNGYMWQFDSPFPADNDILSGAKVFIILGCFLYMSSDELRHTSFCAANMEGKHVSTSFGTICPVGNDAD
jgi:hypothetical protein